MSLFPYGILGERVNVAKADFEYQPRKLERGYNNRTLYVNLSEMKIMSEPVSEKMKETFTGGRCYGNGQSIALVFFHCFTPFCHQQLTRQLKPGHQNQFSERDFSHFGSTLAII